VLVVAQLALFVTKMGGGIGLTRGLYYKTFYGHNLRIFIIS
jgi:hypothetical protein